jgi:hypothetical protein
MITSVTGNTPLRSTKYRWLYPPTPGLYCMHPMSNYLPVSTYKHCFSNYFHLLLLTTTLLALHLSYFPRMIYTHLHYTYMDMFLNFLVLWFCCTLQIFLNANFSFTASHSLFKNYSPHLFVPKQLKQREWHSPHEVTQFISHLNPSISKSPLWTLLPNFSHFYYNMIYNPPFPTQLLLHHKTLVNPVTLTFAQDRLYLYIVTLRSIVSDPAFAHLSTGYAKWIFSTPYCYSWQSPTRYLPNLTPVLHSQTQLK